MIEVESRANTKPVLLVEDDPSIAEVLELLLADDGYRVTPAHDGAQAIAAARSERFGLVLLDLMLPGMGGDELLATLRPHIGRTPVLVLTAARDGASRARASDAAGFLPKPFEIEDLLTRMRALYRL